MREHGVPQFTVDAHRPVGAFDVLGRRFSTELGYTNMLTALDLAFIPLHAIDRRATRSCWPAATRAFNPEPIADFIDAAVLGDGEEAVLEITDDHPRVEGRGPTGRTRRAAAAARRPAVGSTCPVLRRRLPARRPDPAGRAEPRRRPVPDRQAHDDGSRRLAVPEEAAGPARRDGARALRGGDLPRLHARLPLLPGRHDHPTGSRADHHDHRRDGARRPRRLRFSTRSACSRCPARTTPRSATSPTGWPTSTPARNVSPVAAVHPGGRVQHRPRQRAVAQRSAHRPDVRARGRFASGSAR